MGNQLYKEKVQFCAWCTTVFGAVGFEAEDGKLILKKHRIVAEDDGYEAVRFGRKSLAELS
eukprot:TRINITY_DN5112_c0_g1_i1.p1 TRINITY_DN5112_c0_g1~~TRINITY_DN5112_c0_g1_i1.p1  ORF type:complete len:61 (-),score=14.14 TRINITY_DN5112_c0_g1_i1:64-246(-)